MDSLDKIAPILIFFIWVIISIVAQSKKNNQKKPTESKPAEHTTPRYRKMSQTSTGTPYTKQETSRRQAPAFEDLKRKLEKIFNESLPADDDHSHDDSYLKYEKKQPAEIPVAVPEAIPAEETQPEQMNTEKKTWFNHKIADIYNQEEGQSVQAVPAIDLSIEKLREGFLLSEIIAPPVALRDHDFESLSPR